MKVPLFDLIVQYNNLIFIIYNDLHGVIMNANYRIKSIWEKLGFAITIYPSPQSLSQNLF